MKFRVVETGQIVEAHDPVTLSVGEKIPFVNDGREWKIRDMSHWDTIVVCYQGINCELAYVDSPPDPDPKYSKEQILARFCR